MTNKVFDLQLVNGNLVYKGLVVESITYTQNDGVSLYNDTEYETQLKNGKRLTTQTLQELLELVDENNPS